MALRAAHLLVLAALVAAVAAGLALGATGQLSALTVTPARTHGTASGGATFGPIGLRNTTTQAFKVRVFPVLLGQDRQGGLLAQDDARSVRRASRYITVDRSEAVLPAGSSLSRTVRLRRPTSEHNFYGGLLFKATPRRGAQPSPIVTVYQLNEALLLRPPPPLQRIRVKAAGLRAETDGKKLRVLLAIANRGNTDVRPRGRLRVRNAAGRVLVARPLKAVDIIPDAIVDLPAIITRRLPAGDYTLDAKVRAGGRVVRARAPMRLFGVNEVETRDARLSEFDSPAAYRGEAVDIDAEFRNAGNVPFAPRAEISAKRVAPKEGPAGEQVELDVDEVDPGEDGKISGSVDLPGSTGAFELTLRILDGNRVLDSRAVTVTPVAKPNVFVRTRNWATDHVIGLVGVMLGGMLALIAAVIYASSPRR